MYYVSVTHTDRRWMLQGLILIALDRGGESSFPIVVTIVLTVAQTIVIVRCDKKKDDSKWIVHYRSMS